MFGFNKATLLAILSLSLSSAILHYSHSTHLNVEEKDTRRFLSSGRTLLKTALSSVLKILFESPLSGESMKTISCFAAFGLAGINFAEVDR